MARSLKDAAGGSGPFGGLDRRTVRWLDCEQTLNEHLIHDFFDPGTHRNNTVRPGLRPEQRPVWNQEVVWLPRDLVRCYGSVEAEIRAAFGFEPPKDHTPLFLHPQPPASHRRLRQEIGSRQLTGVAATPTASYRSVVAWHRNGPSAPPP